MKRRILSLFIALAICLSLAPITVMAADVDTVYVGGVELTGSTDFPAYAKTDESGNVSPDGADENSYNIKWDGTTLTLKDANVTGQVNSGNIAGAAIGVENSNGAELTIRLEGSNTVSASIGIYVHSSGGNTSLTITGNGSLNASSSFNPAIRVQSNGSDATLSIENAKVTATASSSGEGVLVQSKNDSSVSLTVDGGSLTATGSGATFAGIIMQFGSSDSGFGTPTVTVSDNAIVRASGNAGGIASNASAVTPSGTGIVFDGKNGTVYGKVELQEDLEIGEGESLTIPDGASLNTGNYTLTVNSGELTGKVTGGVIYKVTGVSLNNDSLTLNVGGSETITATIVPTNATNKSVTWRSDNEKVATVNANGEVSAVGIGTAKITVATKDGSFTAACEVTVTSKQIPSEDHKPSKPDKTQEDKKLPSNTAECQREYGKDYVYSKEYGACIIKHLIIPDTSCKYN